MSESKQQSSKKPGKFRWLLRLAILLPILLIGLLIIAVTIAKSFVTPDYVAALIEEEYNCRVNIGTTDVSLFSFPAKIELKNVKIYQRDSHADAGTFLADRPNIDVGVINAESITLEANLLDLIKKKISVKHLTIEKLFVAEFLIEKEGGNSLDPLFDPPATVKGSPNPEFEAKKQRRELAKERRKLAKEERTAATPETPFTITELPLPATMSALNINNAQINAKLRSNKTRITISDLQIQISDIDLDPSDLTNHNQAKVTVTGHLDIEDRDRTVKYADLNITSQGEVIPFDPITGYINPDLIYKITVLKDSKLDTIPSLVKLAGKVKKLNEIGLKLDALAASVILEKDTSVSLGYNNSTLRLLEPASIEFNQHLLAIDTGAWLHTGNNQHEAKAAVTLSASASDNALTNARTFIAEKTQQYIDKDTVLKFANKILSPVIKNDRVWVPFVSTGDLNDPKVRPEVDLEDLAESIALDALGEILDRTQKDAGK